MSTTLNYSRTAGQGAAAELNQLRRVSQARSGSAVGPRPRAGSQIPMKPGTAKSNAIATIAIEMSPRHRS